MPNVAAATRDDRTVRSADGRDHVDFSRNVVCLFGLPFDALRLEQAAARVVDAATGGAPCFFSTPNINFLMLARRNRAFRQSVLASDMSLIDGTPLIWMARWLGLPLPERVAGSDLFDHLRHHGGSVLHVFFFGGPDGAARAAAAAIDRQPSGSMRSAGFCEPGYGTVEALSTPRYIAQINASGANVLTAALGAEKGQAWIMRNRASLRPPVVAHLGAVVNFVAGRVARAPVWMRRIGMEWAWRVLREPALWRRYAVDASALLALCARQLWPLRAVQRRLAARPDPHGPGWSLRSEGPPTRIELRGAHRGGNMQPWREALAAAACSGHDTVLSLGPVVDVDASAAGLLLLLEGYLAQRRASLRLEGTDPELTLALRYSGLGHLLAPTTPASGETDGGRDWRAETMSAR